MIKDLIDRSFVVITVFKPRAASFPTLRVYSPANVKLASTAADIGHTPFFSDSTSLVANYSTNIGSTVAGYIMKAQFRSFSRPQEKDYHLMACPGYQKEKRQKENHPQHKGTAPAVIVMMFVIPSSPKRNLTIRLDHVRARPENQANERIAPRRRAKVCKTTQAALYSESLLPLLLLLPRLLSLSLSPPPPPAPSNNPPAIPLKSFPADPLPANKSWMRSASSLPVDSGFLFPSLSNRGGKSVVPSES